MGGVFFIMGKLSEQNICIVYQNFSFDIRILHWGIEDDPNHVIIGSNIDRFALAYITDGSGIYSANSRVFEIKKGDVYLLSQNVRFSQRTNAQHGYKYIYIAFCGSNAKLILDKCGFTATSPVFHVNDDRIEALFRKVYDSCQKNTFASIAKANLYLIDILCCFIERNAENNAPVRVNKNILIESAQSYIEENYFKDLTVNDICRHTFCNRSYLSKLFKTVCNTTIMKYLSDYRIEKAMEMLIHTNLSIVSIIERIGFNDYTNFYRQFVKKTGRSPKVYRRENMNTLNLPTENE